MNRALRHPAAPAVISAIAALIVYAVTLGGTFVYDDFDVFAIDDRLRNPAQWWRYFTESYNGGVDNLYRPLVSMTYAIQWWLHGDQIKWPYHAVNWLLHAGVSALVAEFARRLTPSPRARGEGGGEVTSASAEAGLAVGVTTRPRADPSPSLSSSTGKGAGSAYLAGILFAVHPIHVEAVANVVGRAELLCALAFLGALVLFARPLTPPRAWAIFGCLIVSILSKEQGILLPAMLLAMALLMRNTKRLVEPPHLDHRPGDALSYAPIRPRTRLSTSAMLLVFLVCWSVAGYIVFRESILKFSWDRAFLDWTINPLIRADGIHRWLVPFTILGRYVALLFAPITLSADYGATVIGWTVRFDDPYFWIGALAAVAYVLVFVVAAKFRHRPALICLIGLALTYGLISNALILIGTNFGERLIYLPSAFFLILIAMLLARSRWMTIGAVLVIALFSIRTITYAQRWNNRESFYKYSIANQPKSIRLRMLLIAELQSQKKLEEADHVARDARELLPDYDEIWLQSADIAEARGEFDRAREYLDRAMHIRPREKTAMRMQLLDEKRHPPAAASQPK